MTTGANIYIASTATFSEQTDVKTLIRDAGARRRMSRLVKMGVATGLECLVRAGETSPDAIVTATGYGFLADSERLLREMAAAGEEMMSPTPFMQSTFNTIGSQLALACGCRGQNLTFSNGHASFGSALVGAASLLLSGEARNALIVAADELTPTLSTVLARLGARRRGTEPGEGATAILLTTRADNSLATIGQLRPTATTLPTTAADAAYPTAAAARMAHMVESRTGGTFETAGAACLVSFS